MSDLYGPSTSSDEPQSKRARFPEDEEILEQDWLYKEEFPLSGDSDTEFESESEEEAGRPNVSEEKDNEDVSNLSIEEKWIDERPVTQKFPFEENNGLNRDPDYVTPLSFFNMLFTDSFLEFLVLEINVYARHVVSAASINRGRLNEWKDTNVDEIRVFLGLLFLMGIIRVNRMNDYWRKHLLFNLPFSKFMGRDRFLLILRCLRFDREQASVDVLHKIRPILVYFNDTMAQLYTPSRELIVDESKVLSQGRLVFRQHLADKVYKYGIKLYVLAEPSGMVQKIYVHPVSANKELSETDDHSMVVVRKLLEGREGKGHAIYMDDYYTSVALVEELILNKTYCTGTLRTLRKRNPPAVTNAVLKRGNLRRQYTKDGICCCKWKDKREVLCISSEYGERMVETKNRLDEKIYKPELIVYYSKFMKAVHRQDQMLSYYPMMHKSLRWYKKVGIHVMHIMLNNVHILYNRYSNTKKSLHDFQLDVIMGLLPCPQQENINHTVSVHLPEALPKDKSGRTMRKRCRYCMEVAKKRKDTIFCCPVCPSTPGLCLSPCFRAAHSYN